MEKNCRILSIKAREIINSDQRPAIEVELKTDLGKFRASAPSGVSTGQYEAVELLDKNASGVKTAAKNIEEIIAPALKDADITDQAGIDKIMIDLDGTANKSRLGVNAILPVSIAACRAAAKNKKVFLWQYISKLAGLSFLQSLPKGSFNMIEGGKHGNGLLAFQEFMAVPQKEKFSENLEIGKKVYNQLGKILGKKFKNKITKSKEGAFCGSFSFAKEALDFILQAAKEAGCRDKVMIAIDAAASEFFENNEYRAEGRIFPRDALANFYLDLLKNYPIISIEDPFSENDFPGWKEFRLRAKNSGTKTLIIGDDLTVTNLRRIKLARQENLCNGLIVKPNQIGTVSETIAAVKLAKAYNWPIMVANRAGETEDDFIADLAVGIGAEFIKSGAPFPKERMAKYQRLAKIEEELNV